VIVPKKAPITKLIQEEVFNSLTPLLKHLQNQPKFFVDPNNKEIILKANSETPLEMQKEDIVYDGFYLTLDQPLDFEPMVDMIIVENPQHKEGKPKKHLSILVDVPGFCHLKRDKNQPKYKNSCSLDVKVVKQNSSLTISGSRRTHYLQAVDAEFTNTCIQYGELAENPKEQIVPPVTIDRKERKIGNFTRTIRIPSTFDLQTAKLRFIDDGQFQIDIDAFEDDDDDDDYY